MDKPFTTLHAGYIVEVIQQGNVGDYKLCILYAAYLQSGLRPEKNTMNTGRSDIKDVIRFCKKIKLTKGCWLYTGFIDSRGYGQFWSKGKKISPHRFSYELFVGKIPKGLTIDHLCRIPKCVNSNHMEVVTREENSYRSSIIQFNLNKTHCIHGHKFTVENTYIHITTKERVCRECKRLWYHKKYYAKRRIKN